MHGVYASADSFKAFILPIQQLLEGGKMRGLRIENDKTHSMGIDSL
jgi:hypothetical protein